ncbi:MAG: class I SAM-dependent methyltransferase [Ktedonobacteraceae bacterium]|nr:class I SAM-dependent methyltransferase [Ktedonobacteraceae bacterium]
MEGYLKKTIRTYDQIATGYMLSTSNLQPGKEFTAFSQRVITGDTVLDAGCGGGRDCKAFAELGFHVIGIDLSVEMLKIARNLAPGCEFLQTDLRKIPLSDNFVDGVWCCASLLHLKRKEVRRALLEFRRVLKEGAVCCIVIKKGTGEKFIKDRRSQGKPRFYSYFQPGEIRELCKSLDFEILTGETTQSGSGTYRQDWLFFLLRKPDRA